MKIDGERLRRARERRALSQGELAEAAGVSRLTVGRFERGESIAAQPATVRKIAAALGVEPAELIDESGGQRRPRGQRRAEAGSSS